MTQLALVVYLEHMGCVEVREDSKGYFVMRNQSNGKLSGVPVPTTEDGMLKQSTICQVCKTLGIDIPPTASKEMEAIMEKIHADVKKRIEQRNC